MQRSLQESLAHTLALAVPVDVSPVALIEHKAGQCVGPAYELGCADCVHGNYFILNRFLIIDHPKPVPLLQAEEIDCPSIDIRKREDEQRRHPGILHIHPQRCIDGHIRKPLAGNHFLFTRPGFEGRSASEDH